MVIYVFSVLTRLSAVVDQLRTTQVRSCLFINYFTRYVCIVFGSVSRRCTRNWVANQNISTRIPAKSSITLGTSYARDSICFSTNQTWNKVNTMFQTLYICFQQNNIIKLVYFNRLFAYYVLYLSKQIIITQSMVREHNTEIWNIMRFYTIIFENKQYTYKS